MRRQPLLILPFVLGACLTVAPALALSYSGMLAYDNAPSPANNGLFVGGPNWPVEDATWINWIVTLNGNGTWHYDYTFNTPGPGAAISHFVLEVSPNFDASDVLNFGSDQAGMTTLLGNYSSLNGNPGMPDLMYGLKVSAAGFTNYHFWFDSNHMPVWGDFYAKCGAPPPNTNRAWNLGFTAADTDPVVPPQNGTISFHILRPDGQIPEPGTLGLMGFGVAALLLRARRRSAT